MKLNIGKINQRKSPYCPRSAILFGAEAKEGNGKEKTEKTARTASL
jgi:hypothetical protein